MKAFSIKHKTVEDYATFLEKRYKQPREKVMLIIKTYGINSESELARQKRVNFSIKSMQNTKKHYNGFIKKRAENIKNKETWGGKFKVDSKGYLI